MNARDAHGMCNLTLLPRPLAMDEHRDLLALGGDTRDVEVVGADHEVHVLGALVDTGGLELRGREVVTALSSSVGERS